MRKNMLTETIRTHATSLKDSLLQLRQSGPKKESKSPLYTTLAIFGTNKFFWDVAFCHRCPKKSFSLFCFASPEIIGVKVCKRRMDGWTDRRTDGRTDGRANSLQGYVDFFFQLNLLPPARRGKIRFSEESGVPMVGLFEKPVVWFLGRTKYLVKKELMNGLLIH